MKETIKLSEIVKGIELENISTSLLSDQKVNHLKTGENINLSLNFGLKKDDPQKTENGFTINPNFKLIAQDKDGKEYFIHESRLNIVIKSSQETYNLIWENNNKNEFLSKYLTPIIWPYIRQQVQDGLLRVGMPIFSLPFEFSKLPI
ncbi:hypothetical protein [Oceanispirochaeta sp.]|jgi:preprotein translocase subunit SecB|uniref:hypothetical protein n=1 Tax=Oceanispirochaeta sp. TaxID=2035350 RepID=UPI00262F56EC|nr:hypothetical protein [Oceanispirochaeta sp.]MDA3957567.1 hypothetical protein [Oceanispirochaeta sp.]